MSSFSVIKMYISMIIVYKDGFTKIINKFNFESSIYYIQNDF